LEAFFLTGSKKGIQPAHAAQRRQLGELVQLFRTTHLPAHIVSVHAPSPFAWIHARRGALYRPLRQPVTIRLDADVVAWFKEHAAAGGGYQTEINRVLRRHVALTEKRRA
jgi:hypothetical protein